MSVCINVIRGVAVTTNGTSVGSIACIFTIGKSYCRIVLMSVCGNDLLRIGYGTTYSTLLTHGKAGLGASRCYCIKINLGVTVCGNGSLRYGCSATYCTLLTFGNTCGGTSGCRAGNCCFSMRCEASVFLTTLRAYRSLLTSSGTSNAYVINFIDCLVNRSYICRNCIFISFSIHKKQLHFSKLLGLKSGLIIICS